MKYRRLTGDGDYTFGNGSYNYCSDSEAVAQAIKTRILLLRGEWWENVRSGTDLFGTILTQRVSETGKNVIDITIKERILSVEGVSSIKSFISEVNNNAHSYTAKLIIETIYGDIEQTVELGG